MYSTLTAPYFHIHDSSLPVLVFVWLCSAPDQEKDLDKKICLFDLAFFVVVVSGAFFFFFSPANVQPHVQTESSKEI